jgi:hypothetical protein
MGPAWHCPRRGRAPPGPAGSAGRATSRPAAPAWRVPTSRPVASTPTQAMSPPAATILTPAMSRAAMPGRGRAREWARDRAPTDGRRASERVGLRLARRPVTGDAPPALAVIAAPAPCSSTAASPAPSPCAGQRPPPEAARSRSRPRRRFVAAGGRDSREPPPTLDVLRSSAQRSPNMPACGPSHWDRSCRAGGELAPPHGSRRIEAIAALRQWKWGRHSPPRLRRQRRHRPRRRSGDPPPVR